MAEKIRWGILGTGSIAKKFAEGLASVSDAELVAVGSRAQQTADAFGERYGVPRRHASYDALAHDPGVDVIYVSTPHSEHMACSLLCLEAGKAVLCEKPFAINAAQAERMVAAARRRKVFLMEAMWSRFFPLMGRVRELLADGALGEVRMVAADFGFRAGVNPQSRLFNPHLGGGALLDVGIYPISFASMVYGEQPERIVSMANLGETGVDEQSAVLFGYPGGGMAALYTAIRTRTLQAAEILGTDGALRIEPAFWHADRATLLRGKETEHLHMPYEGNGYNYEAAAVGRCLREGELECDVMPLDESVAIMRTLDAVRAQWGLRYPME